MYELFTVGLLRWAAPKRLQRLLQCLQDAGVDLLLDVRHAPCASSLDPKSNYGPRPWHLQRHGGIAANLANHAIGYEWIVELGNPQKKDEAMRILRQHLAQPGNGWPVHRGLAILRRRVVDQEKRCCLLCACKYYEMCHRTLIASALAGQIAPAALSITHLP